MSPELDERRLVVLCDDTGQATGTVDIIAAHRDAGQLHQAFSVFVFRQLGESWELLIQQRSAHKPLFAMKWANTCCSHPRPSDEDICEAGQRRLKEECGFLIPLQVAGSFVYRATDSTSGGTEYEHDTVLVGQTSDDVQVRTDPREIEESKWVTLDDLNCALQNNDDQFAPWFRPALKFALVRIGADNIATDDAD